MLSSMIGAAASLTLASFVKIPSTRPLVVSLFQEDCGACKKQQAELSCFAEQGWTVVTVGVGDRRFNLRHQGLRDSKGRFDPQFMSWEAARQLGVYGTPTNFVFEHEAKTSKLAGLLVCPKRSP